MIAQTENPRRCSLKLPLPLPDGGLQREWPSSRRRTHPEWLTSHKGMSPNGVNSPSAEARAPHP